MLNAREEQYGSASWFVNEYAKVDDDPWGLSWRSSQKVRYARILSLLEAIEHPPSSVLDIGCSTGDFTYLLKNKYGQHSSVIGIDFIENAIDRAKEKYQEVNFRIGSIFDIGLEYEGQMDLVTCLETLYYLDRKECPAALKSVRRSIRHGGYAVFSSLISKAPYFSVQELRHLVSTQFSLIQSQTIHIKILSLGERIAVKLEKLGKQKLYLPQSINMAKNIFRLVPFQVADLMEKACSYMGNTSASHALVLGRRM